MTQKTMLVSHGNKGGVGKSYTASLLIESLLARGLRVALIESDPTQPDVATRYVGDPDLEIGALSMNRAGDSENALAAFGAWLESHPIDHVVVNLPGGAGETLDRTGDMLRDLTDALEYKLIVTYSLEKNRVAADGLMRSASEGLLSHVESENRFVLIPEFKGAPGSFEWMTHPVRQELGMKEIVIPALGSRSALQQLEATPGRIAALIDKSARPAGWMILDQSSVYRWYHASIAAVQPIIGE